MYTGTIKSIVIIIFFGLWMGGSLSANAELGQLSPPTTASTSANEAANKLDLDIVGLKLGMSENEVIGAIKSLERMQEHQELRGSFSGIPNTNHLATLYAGSVQEVRRNKYSEEIFVEFPPSPNNSVAIGIRRTNHYGKGEAPALESVKKALIDKYGSPSTESKTRSGVIMDWYADSHGNRISGKRTNCRVSRPNRNLGAINQADNGDRYRREHEGHFDDWFLRAAAAHATNPLCGGSLQVQIHGRSSERMTIVTFLADHQQLIQAKKLTDQMVAEHERKVREQKEAEVKQRSAPAF